MIRPIQIPAEIAQDIATALRGIDHEAEQRRRESRASWTNADGRSSANWIGDMTTSSPVGFRKSSGPGNPRTGRRNWLASMRIGHASNSRGRSRPQRAKILELAKKAEFLYKTQDPAEQRRLLETVLSNCTLIVEVFVLPTVSHSTCSSAATKQEIGGESGIRTLGRVSPTHAFQACSFNHSDISPCLTINSLWRAVQP